MRSMELDIERRVWSGDEAEDDDGEDDVREDYCISIYHNFWFVILIFFHQVNTV